MDERMNAKSPASFQTADLKTLSMMISSRSNPE
jgi:hypothetical protein